MDITRFIAREGEKPLDNIVPDGGFCRIFRTIGCIGDSFSSGEFQSRDKNGMPGYHDFYEYSWGQFIARETGSKVYNFSRGGMTAEAYIQSFADQKGFWDEDKLCQAYILALGVNDILNQKQESGTVQDICPDDFYRNTKNFAGNYAHIIQKLKTMQPQAKFFLMTMPRETDEEVNKCKKEHADLLYDLAKLFDYTYVIDLFRYGPVYDEAFKQNFYLDSHMNPAGYVLTAKMVMSYIDYIVRTNPEDFAQVGFIGKAYHNHQAIW